MRHTKQKVHWCVKKRWRSGFNENMININAIFYVGLDARFNKLWITELVMCQSPNVSVY